MKKTGIELIAQERKEQITKHKFSSENDAIYTEEQLRKAAASIIIHDHAIFPWSPEYYLHIMEKTEVEQLTIAGALIAAEIDRIQSIIPSDGPLTEDQILVGDKVIVNGKQEGVVTVRSKYLIRIKLEHSTHIIDCFRPGCLAIDLGIQKKEINS
ncbi:hypothetical protein ACR79B_11120 [Sphingobacterium spiritivorum]|uniref:hypothetical protein n=1 Tax=Sphingobacterium spiritivorum TaxID=258 RepID=UPI003DA430BD